jgi:hypothetical protein
MSKPISNRFSNIFYSFFSRSFCSCLCFNNYSFIVILYLIVVWTVYSFLLTPSLNLFYWVCVYFVPSNMIADSPVSSSSTSTYLICAFLAAERISLQLPTALLNTTIASLALTPSFFNPV